MRYAQIRDMDVSNGEGVGVALFTQGCPFHCKGCFNQGTWDFNSGKPWSDTEEQLVLQYLEPKYIKRLSILGGEPLISRNIPCLLSLCNKMKFIYPDKKIWLYTGNSYEAVLETYPDILSYIDVLIDGRYVDELRDFNLKWRGSSNQRVIDVQKSLKKREVVLYL